MFEHDYTAADRLLHRLALGVPTVAELSFDLDQRASGAAALVPEVRAGEHVFVTGLARSGTTVMLRHLHRSGPFRSLTYRDMPFVLAPNLWKRFSARWQRRQEERLRAHGDRIMVSADSPEALEEVFWRIFSGSDYIRRDALVPYRPDGDVLARFRRYVAAILAPGGSGQRYLSKNNNNILRLSALRDAFPNAFVVIPFRHPATQASSLWRQHKLFSGMQEESPFVRSYMDWLGHHEFGQGHRPFLFGGGPPRDLSPELPDYWLDTWTRAHEALTAQADERSLFVCYEDLCADPSVWKGLTRRLGLAAAKPDFAISRAAPSDRFDPARMWRAEEVYARLRQPEFVGSA
ncbi:MAG TPA: sulfotransferase [Novosphingobium sp.]|nr:sulfotransferase [Novosphingobium sp.]